MKFTPLAAFCQASVDYQCQCHQMREMAIKRGIICIVIKVLHSGKASGGITNDTIDDRLFQHCHLVRWLKRTWSW